MNNRKMDAPEFVSDQNFTELLPDGLMTGDRKWKQEAQMKKWIHVTPDRCRSERGA